MMKLLAAGIWVCLVTLGSTYMAVAWKKAHYAAATGETEPKPVLIPITPQPITVPVVTGGAVAGYVVAQFTFSVDRAQLKTDPALLEPVIKDESFRTLYAGEAGDFRTPKRSDLQRLTGALIKSINTRFGSDIVKQVLIEEMVFVPKEKTRTGGGALYKRSGS